MRIVPAILFSLLTITACKPKPPVRTQIPVSEDTTFLTGIFYVVRHAEQHPGGDSTLTETGLQRAGELSRLLRDSGINKIYLTPFKRSIQTADSVRIQLHVDTCFYKADTTGESLIYEITRHGDWGKHLLIIGHSNTLVPVLHSLKATPHMKTVGENEYGWLFVVRKTTKGTTLKEDCY
ncbi:MAG TPA: histidine phosphatase family protein [Chitinophaga sp.]|uniref:histidine phosphatase family protein n=1 Tax=Chitinophaga sp. TaxID=1869181 RepID=UPI002BA944D7|nr:histidine phosphatase family protein [Chitinophaga sp.]HVI45954.1 histidine phosphatase family protein [Chitinophaga sp.]